MDNPIFKLEGVVHERSAETLQDFEGPLDLILFLLSKNKIEIQDIPIALILEQYLAYLEQRKQLDLEVASEFITMAAHLMYIKTRMLLSIEDEEAQNEMEQLIQSLKERQRDRGDLYGGAGAVPRERDPSRGRRDRLHGGLRAGRIGNFYIVRNVWHWKRWTYMRSARRWRAFSLPPASR